jgi:hypothetical protein
MLNLLLILVAILIIVLIAIVITLFNININYLSADKIRTLSIDEIGLIIENDFNNGVDILKYYYDWRFKFHVALLTIFTSLSIGLIVVLIRDYSTHEDELRMFLIFLIVTLLLIISYILFRLNSIPNEFVTRFKLYYELKEDLDV